MKHNPWLKFWPQDWLTDIELRSCSSAQRGTLIDLMCVAHRSESYGVILDNDTPESRKMLAKCLSLTERTLNNHLTSLLQMTRICRTDDGQLFIKRMVQDHHKSLTNSENGKKGGSPSLKPSVKAEENRIEENIIELPLGLPTNNNDKNENKKSVLSAKQKQNQKHDEITPTMEVIGSWFNRRKSTKWSVYEAEALAVLGDVSDDLAQMGTYYTNCTEYMRTSVETLLNNWHSEMDKARLYTPPVENARNGVKV